MTYGLIALNVPGLPAAADAAGRGFDAFTIAFGMIPIVVRDLVDAPGRLAARLG